ncbi:MAG: four helix bundle protein [Methylomicrobium sp.]|uniref:four helix bundle protein n=1 Tax=Methylicorpusculum oleiharenae TaxID=1338687 RepID=UPI00135C8EBC|nr:four helix bundle protein [Methylomicrobium sp.]
MTLHKLGIAQKETNETFYWLERLKETDYLNQSQFQSLQHETTEIIKSSKKNY